MIHDRLLDSYDYATDPVLKEKFHAVAARMDERMANYGGAFGPYMVAHQDRVAEDAGAFMLSEGYSQRAVDNFKAAMRMHDMGKTHKSYDPGIWQLPEKPTPEQKAIRRMHPQCGARMIRNMMKYDGENDDQDLVMHNHLRALNLVTLFHHERKDGKGPKGINAANLPRFVQIAILADTFDGDTHPHPQILRTPQEALRRMQDPDSKYAGAFEPELLAKYIAFKEAQLAPRQPVWKPERMPVSA